MLKSNLPASDGRPFLRLLTRLCIFLMLCIALTFVVRADSDEVDELPQPFGHSEADSMTGNLSEEDMQEDEAVIPERHRFPTRYEDLLPQPFGRPPPDQDVISEEARHADDQDDEVLESIDDLQELVESIGDAQAGIEPRTDIDREQVFTFPRPFDPDEVIDLDQEDDDILSEPVEPLPESMIRQPPVEDFPRAHLDPSTPENQIEEVLEDIDSRPRARFESAVSIDEADYLLYDALDLVIDEEYAAAIPELERVIELKPSLGAAWEALGWSYHFTGKTEKTRQLWNRFRVLDPDRPLPYNLLAKLAIADGDLEKAIEYYNISLELDPTQRNIRYDLARTRRWRGDLDISIDMLWGVLEEDPHRNDVVLELARTLTDRWEFEQALPLWERLLGFAPRNLEFMEGAALCRLHTNDVLGSFELVRELLRDHRNNQTALTISANIAERSDQPELAVPYLERLLRLQDTPNNAEIMRVRLLRLYVRLFRKDPEMYGLRRAIELSEQRLEHDSDSVDARLMLAELRLMNGQFREAERLFGYVLARVNAHNTRARKGMFETQIAMADFKEAERQLVGLASFNPHDPYLNYYRYRLKSAQGDYYNAHRALDDLERIGRKGAVPVFLYHGVLPSQYFMEAVPIANFRDQIRTLREHGFTLMKSSDIPQFFKDRSFYDQGIMLDEMRYNIPPEKVVVINFDDARRDQMEYVTPIAQDMNAVFSMHVPTGYVDMRHPFIATWEQLIESDKAGVWDFGSHFKDGAILTEIDEHGTIGRPLPNRIWLAEENRMETHQEYERRLAVESRESRRLLQENLSGSVNFTSYPFGDVGQEVGTNVRNPVRTILNQVRPHYDVGFIQSPFGFAVNTDDPLLYQRHELDRSATGQDLIDHIYTNHPVYMAQRLRAEMAALQGKYYLATDTLRRLEESGYPPNLLEKLQDRVYSRLSRRIETGDVTWGNEEFFGLGLRNPYLDANLEYFADNQERTTRLYTARGGVQLSPHITVEGRVGTGRHEQDVLPEEPGDPSRPLKVDEINYGGRLVYNFTGNVYVLGELLQREFSSIPNEYDKLKYAFEGHLRPVMPMDLILRFEHDAAPSALAIEREIDVNAFTANGLYRVTDYWDLSAAAMHFSFSDDNDRSHASLGSSWLLHERTGFRSGIGFSYASAEDDSEAYWTPYNLQRYFVEAGYQGNYMRAYYHLRLRLGMGRESVRPEREAAFQETVLRARALGFDPGPAPEAEWKSVVSIFGSTRFPIKNNWILNGNISYNRLPNYNSLEIRAGLQYRF